MVTEDYVSLETAMLLKEKGFECANLHYYYDEDGDLLFSAWNIGAGKNRLVAPTLQMAMKWLRKEHGLHCHSDYDIVLGWYCQITSLTETVEYDYEEMKHYHPDKDNGFSSPEEACEEAIRYCLEKLI
jgi:hypothetical protein